MFHALATAVALVGISLPITPSSSQPMTYDALGDSYASGVGAPPYSSCQRSALAYPELLDATASIDLDDFVACGGATTGSLVSGGQLDALDEDTDLVTLSIGGNDIGWTTVLNACMAGSDQQCAGALASSRVKVTTELPAKLRDVYAQVGDRAPNARVIVTGYARLFEVRAGAYLGASPAEQREINAGADQLNAVLKREARAAGFRFADVTYRFLVHAANSRAAWVLDAFDDHGQLDGGAFHPTARGYASYAQAVRAQLLSERLGVRP